LPCRSDFGNGARGALPARAARAKRHYSGRRAGCQAAAAAGNLIHAIKLYRERTGCGLKEAKDAVERIRGR
jgi:ribosomal protein L7/L12